MAIEFFTGFEGCGTTADLQSFLSSSYTTVLPAYSSNGGFEDSKSLSVGNTSTYFTIDKNVTAGLTKVVGFHIKNAGFYSYSSSYYTRSLCKFTGPEIYIWNNSTGFQIYRGTTSLATVTGYWITTDQTHVEIKCYSHSSAGTVGIKINGQTIYSGTGLNTGGQNITSMYFGNTNVANALYDNICIATDWVGEVRSLMRKPTSDADVSFTKSSGSYNYEMVDDTSEDGDATYNASATIGAYDLLGYEDVPADYSIKGVSLVTVARKSDVGDRSLQNIVSQGVTEYELSEKVLSSVYPGAAANNPIIDILDVAPDTSAWTPSIFNDIDWGYKVSA